MTEPGAYGGPTALRIMLGVHLRRLREEAGISRTDAGWAIRGSESKISRLELGRVGFKVRDVDDLLKLYKLDDADERLSADLGRDIQQMLRKLRPSHIADGQLGGRLLNARR